MKKQRKQRNVRRKPGPGLRSVRSYVVSDTVRLPPFAVREGYKEEWRARAEAGDAEAAAEMAVYCALELALHDPSVQAEFNREGIRVIESSVDRDGKPWPR